MPPEVAPQQPPAVIDGPAPSLNQDPNLAVKPDADPAPAQSVHADSDPAVVSEKMQRELQEQRRKRQLAEQENAYLRGQLDARVVQPVVTSDTVLDKVIIPARPKMENFESPEAYETALDVYNDARVEAKLAEKHEKERLEREQEKARESIAQVDAGYSEKMLKQRELYPEVDEAIGRIARRLSPEMQLVIKKSDIPAALITYLDANPQEITRLNAMDTTDKARVIGKIEAQIEAKDKPQGDIRTVSQAPDPLKIPNTPGPPQAVEFDKMSDEAFFAMRKKKREEEFARAGSR